MPNLIEGLIEEQNRVRELIKVYEGLEGGVGVFGATMLKQSIKRAEASQINGDVIEMLAAYEELKGCE